MRLGLSTRRVTRQSCHFHMIWSWSNKQPEETFLCLHRYGIALHACTCLATQCNFKQSIMCLRGPRFLMAWNMCMCLVKYIMCHEWNVHMATCAIAMHGTRVGTNVQLTFVIHQQLTYQNSVHNCESNTHSALINSRINCQGNGLIAHIILSNILMALIIVVFCCSVPQLYKNKQSGNKVRSM